MTRVARIGGAAALVVAAILIAWTAVGQAAASAASVPGDRGSSTLNDGCTPDGEGWRTGVAHPGTPDASAQIRSRFGGVGRATPRVIEGPHAYDRSSVSRTDASAWFASGSLPSHVAAGDGGPASRATAAHSTSTTPLLLTGTPSAAGAADDIVRYEPPWASRQFAGQNLPGSTGWATTPGGRTLSAHAAERTFVGGPGRVPINPGLIDDILAERTRVAYRGANDTIKIGAPNVCGRCYVVVDAQNINHIVTVMVSK